MKESLKKWWRVRDNRLKTMSVVLAGLLILYALLVTGGGSARDVGMDAITAELTDVTADMLERDENDLQKTFGTDGASLDAWRFWSMDSVMDIDELLIARCEESSGLDELEDAVYAHLETQRTSFANYGTDQSFYLKNAVIRRIGRWFFYAVGHDAEAQEQAFLRAVR